MRIAILSDVHSNLPALEAVLADVESVGVDVRYVLGDLVGYAPWPNEVVERLQAEQIPVVMGNYDDGTGFERDECGCAHVDPTEKALGDRSFEWTKAHTSDANKTFLRSLAASIPVEADGHRLLLVHGSPRRMNEYLFEDKPDATFARIAAGTDADVIVCGHTHRPTTRPSARPGSSTSARPANRRTAILVPARRSSIRPAASESISAASHSMSRRLRARSKRPICRTSSRRAPGGARLSRSGAGLRTADRRTEGGSDG